ncbi:MAG: hypothetical protein LBN08_01925 [Lactobacillales bacterium]|jgi:1,4-dihydroxy-2-naphthoate octaprenyltransferase|nr:hypothetical protein [Lactobacillales bacterium]
MDFKKFIEIVDLKRIAVIIPGIVIGTIFSFAHYNSINVAQSLIALAGGVLFYAFANSLKFYITTVAQRKTLFRYIMHTHHKLQQNVVTSDEEAAKAFDELVHEADVITQADLIQAMPDATIDSIVEKEGIETPVTYELKYEHRFRDVTIIFLVLALIAGIVLPIMTGGMTIVIEVACAILYLFYDWTFIPIKNATFAPLIKAFVTSSLMFFLAVYVNSFELKELIATVENWELVFKLDVRVLVGILVVGMPIFLITLAMYLGDSMETFITYYDDDKRTLANYMGLKATKNICVLLIYIAHLWLIPAVIFGFLSPFCLITCLTIIYTFKFVRLVNHEYTQRNVGPAISNILSTFSTVYALTMLVSIIIMVLTKK